MRVLLLNHLTQRGSAGNNRIVRYGFGEGFQNVAPPFVASVAGVAMNHVADADRVTRLSGGAVRSGDYRLAFPHLVEFIVGGWLQLAAAASRQNQKETEYVGNF